MNYRLFIIFFGLTFYGCSRYTNKERYEISVGEEIEIFYKTNSCCYYCISNEEDLVHVKFLKRKTIDKGPEDCAGCNYILAFTFQAKSIGIDTLELKKIGATMNCDENDIQSEQYIIEVK